MYIGKVKSFCDVRGFGFITLSDGRDVFAHQTNIQIQGFRTLAVGSMVSFSLYETTKGLEARDISNE